MSKTSVIINVDPRALEISNHPSAYRVSNLARSKHISPAVVLPDYDGSLYVADGNARATVAENRGEPLPVVLVEDDYRLGPQTAIDRVLGIFFRNKEG